MIRLTEREIIHQINAVEKTTINYGNTEALELLDILICSLSNSKGDNLKNVQLQNAAI